MMDYDIVIRGGTVGTASEVFDADVAIVKDQIAAIGRGLPKGKREIDAKGKLVLPGGVDAHAHIEQLSGMGVMNADTFESGTGAAAFGGTTTVICFAAQHQGKSLTKVVDDYHKLARKGAIIDYAFHMILADPNERVLTEELPPLIKAGHSSIKIFMTYEKTRVAEVAQTGGDFPGNSGAANRVWILQANLIAAAREHNGPGHSDAAGTDDGDGTAGHAAGSAHEGASFGA